MGKWEKYEKKYKKSWEVLPLFKGWLQKNSDPYNCNKEAYCKICETALRAQKSDLEKHGNTKIHRDNASKFVKQKMLEACNVVVVVSDEKKKIDLKLAVYVATHNAVLSIDHLNDLLVDTGKNTIFESLRIHRTKCSKLISNVISPALLRDLVQDVDDEAYSLIVDESTDISTQKYMAICIRYFSKKKVDIATEFLGIIQIVETTAIALYDCVTKYINEIGLPLKNLVGIGTDGASNLCGKNHSLFTLLKERVPLPNLQIVRCICHSLHLCSSKASEVLPSSLEFLVRESRNWFANSTLRRANYAKLFDLINDDNKALLNLVQLSTTRWLAWEGAVKRILYQWLELKTHFDMICNSKGLEKCYTARMLDSMYKDPANHLYLLFLKPVLRDVNEANVLFQSTHEEVLKLHETLSSLVFSVASRVITPEFLDNSKKRLDALEEILENELAFLPLNEVDYGIEFTNTAIAYDLSAKNLKEIKTRCQKYLIVLLTELVKRLPSNMLVLKSAAKLSPAILLKTSVKLDVTELPLSLLEDPSDVSEIESQLRKLRFTDWVELFGEDVGKNATAFWSKVYMEETAGGNRPYYKLARLVLRTLSLPLSNAVVERVFSIMNVTKTKPRNKMGFAMLDAILRIRTHFQTRSSCCKNFTPTPSMYEKFTSQIYDTKRMIEKSGDGQGTSTGEETEESADIILTETMTLFAGEDDGSE